MDAKKSCTFRLSQTARDRLQEIADETRISQAAIIEMLLTSYEVEVKIRERRV